MTENNNQVNPRVFISYSWDSPAHKLWVESFAQELRKAGIDARLDAWRDESQSIDDFMMIELERADYVVAICTPQFKQKIVENAEGTGTASGFEIGTAAALRRSSGKDIIPVLRAGTWLESAPSFLVSYRYYDFTSDDIGDEFAQLRDRLLGHVRRPPELGHVSGPAAAPVLPDIFAKGSKPEPATTAPSSTVSSARRDHSRSAPVASQPAPPPSSPAPARKGYGKFFLGAGSAIVLLIVLIMLLPSGEDSGEPVDSTPQSFVPQDESGYEDTGDYPQEYEDAASLQEPELDAAGDPSQTIELIPGSNPNAQWAFLPGDGECLVLRQLNENSWLRMGYQSSQDFFFLEAYDPAWQQDIEPGKLYYLVLELDEDSNLSYPYEATGIILDGLPGVQVMFDDINFLQNLAQRHYLGFYWDDDPPPYQNWFVMEADLSGSYAALQRLVECAAGFVDS